MLSVNHLTITAGQQQLLSDISFSIAPGQCTVIVGESGSGKTTLLKTILGMQSSNLTWTEGEITIAGTPTKSWQTRDWQRVRGRDVALITQTPKLSFNPWRRIKDLYHDMVKSHPQTTPKPLHDCLEMAGFKRPDQLPSMYPFELSGGMMQRVAIAFAWAFSPKLLLADEPTSALDVVTKQHIMTQLAHYQRDNQATLLLVTHDMSVARRLADNLIVMHQGKIVEQGTASDVLNAPQHPYTKQLIAAIPTIVFKKEVNA